MGLEQREKFYFYFKFNGAIIVRLNFLLRKGGELLIIT